MNDFTFGKLNARQIKALADDHTATYENRLREASGGAKNVRVNECEYLLRLWRSIAAKITQDNWRLRLTTAEKNEIIDAVGTGEYDRMLAALKDPPS